MLVLSLRLFELREVYEVLNVYILNLKLNGWDKITKACDKSKGYQRRYGGRDSIDCSICPGQNAHDTIDCNTSQGWVESSIQWWLACFRW